MTFDKREVIEQLKLERRMVAEGGYGRSVRTPWKETSIFQDSPVCLNFREDGTPHPCEECMLDEFVPEGSRKEPVPCHHIPITRTGESIASLHSRDPEAAAKALLEWLDSTIERLEGELARENG